MLGSSRTGITPLAGATAVITGASSGIGRATALALAQRGVNVVLAARDPETLQQAARECEGAGGQALAVVTDVGDQAAVDALAERARERFGTIDAWVNNAGVILYGHFEKTPPEAFRQVLETNLFGEINGARAALRQFRAQRRGVLVNIDSAWGRVSSPYVTAYVTSKFGIRAFSDCLREGLADMDGSEDIHVCTVLPQSIDTPIFRHTANYVGRQVRGVPPMLAPERVANAIVRCIEHPRRQITLGWFGRLLVLFHWLVPERVFAWLVRQVFDLAAIGSEPAENTPGNLFEPMAELNQVDGEFRSSSPNRQVRAAVAASMALAPAGLAAVWLRRRR